MENDFGKILADALSSKPYILLVWSYDGHVTRHDTWDEALEEYSGQNPNDLENAIFCNGEQVAFVGSAAVESMWRDREEDIAADKRHAASL